jgi:neuronal cell adhesion molecule
MTVMFFSAITAEPPSFIETPQPVAKVAEGQTIVLTCQVFGAPKPTITWKKDNEPLILDPRFKKESNGNLRITVF